MKRLQALITGSGKRLGREMTLFLAAEGYDVALHYHQSGDDVIKLSDELQIKYPGGLFPVVCYDLNNWQEAGGLFNLLPTEFDRIELLVNNASIYQSVSLSNVSAASIEANFAIHCFAPLMLMQVFQQRFDKGLIVNMLDTKINRNEFKFAPYLLSKKSLAELTKMAALEWAPHIRVNAIAPGPVLPAVESDSGNFEKVVAQTPLHEAVTVDEILQTLQFFIHNKHITGQIINVDSGSHLQ